MKSFAPNKLVYESDAPSEQLAVFSEIWYGPDKGWKVYVDDQPARLIRANYALRAMRVPAGKHTIEMRFDPDSVRIGKIISVVSSGLLLLLALGWILHAMGFLSLGKPKS